MGDTIEITPDSPRTGRTLMLKNYCLYSTCISIPTRMSAFALIKALKGNENPPLGYTERKIELAQKAWLNDAVYIPQKAQVLRDWIVDSWSRTKHA
jgi:hypothetical protein